MFTIDLGKKMGGYGSTRWNFHFKKETVEGCWMLSIFDFKRNGLLKPDSYRAGRWVWTNNLTKKQSADLGYELDTRDTRPTLRLFYTVSRWNGPRRDLDYRVFLQRTPCHFGGERWWFACPLAVNGRICRRRVAKIYLPPSGYYFGCRHCYDLTYRSSQESDSRVSALRQLDTLELLRRMNTGEVDMLKGFQALPNDIFDL